MDMGWKAEMLLCIFDVRGGRNPLPYGYGLEDTRTTKTKTEGEVVILCRMDMGWKMMSIEQPNNYSMSS